MRIINSFLNTPTKRLIFVFTILFVLIATYCQFAKILIVNDRYELFYGSTYARSVDDHEFQEEYQKLFNLASDNAIIEPWKDVKVTNKLIYKGGIISGIPTSILIGQMCIAEPSKVLYDAKKTYKILNKTINLTYAFLSKYTIDSVNEDQVCWYPRHGIWYSDSGLSKTDSYPIGVLIDKKSINLLEYDRKDIDEKCDRRNIKIKIIHIAQFLLISVTPIILYLFLYVIYKFFSILYTFIKFGRLKK